MKLFLSRQSVSELLKFPIHGKSSQVPRSYDITWHHQGSPSHIGQQLYIWPQNLTVELHSCQNMFWYSKRSFPITSILPHWCLPFDWTLELPVRHCASYWRSVLLVGTPNMESPRASVRSATPKYGVCRSCSNMEINRRSCPNMEFNDPQIWSLQSDHAQIWR